MTLMDAAAYDPTRGRKRLLVVLGLLCAGCVIAVTAFLTWNLPAEHRINQFFAAIESKDFPQAFGIWNNDAHWQQHPQRYSAAGYSYGRFLNDWGADGEYGTITHHKIVHATSKYGNTTLVVVDINGRTAAPLTLAVQKHEHDLTFPPFSLTATQNVFGWKDWQISYR